MSSNKQNSTAASLQSKSQQNKSTDKIPQAKSDSNPPHEEFPPLASKTDALPAKNAVNRDPTGHGQKDKPLKNSGTPELQFGVTFGKGIGGSLASVSRPKEEQKSPDKTEVGNAPMFQANPFSKTELFHANPFANSELGASQPSPQKAEPETKAQLKFEEAAKKKQTSLKPNQILTLLESSFANIPSPQDQEVIDPKHPSAVSEAHNFPTVPLFNRKENFAKLNLETLFFAFYHQQGTYQQYLAAVELKKKNWKFNKKFETWFKKADAGTSQLDGAQANAQRDVGKYVFFDYENGWQQRVSDEIEMDLTQIENELIVQPAPMAGALNSSMRVLNQ